MSDSISHRNEQLCCSKCGYAIQTNIFARFCCDHRVCAICIHEHLVNAYGILLITLGQFDYRIVEWRNWEMNNTKECIVCHAKSNTWTQFFRSDTNVSVSDIYGYKHGMWRYCPHHNYSPTPSCKFVHITETGSGRPSVCSGSTICIELGCVNRAYVNNLGYCRVHYRQDQVKAEAHKYLITSTSLNVNDVIGIILDYVDFEHPKHYTSNLTTQQLINKCRKMKNREYGAKYTPRAAK